MIGIVAPGQGSQKPGFLTPWLEIDSVTDDLRDLSESAAIDLVSHGTESDAETIRDTAVAQPLLVAASIISFRLLLAELLRASITPPIVTAGHSVGELSCAAIAGVVDDRTAVKLAAQRGASMAIASSVASTGMSAVLGGDTSEVVELIDRLGLTAANMNGAGQVVAAGPLTSLAELRSRAPIGVKVVPLKVAGAFHSPQMSQAADAFAGDTARLTPHDPTIPLISNSDGTVLTKADEVIKRLVHQVRSPVRWDLTAQRMHALGVRKVVELSPGGTLTGMLKRSHPDIRCVAIKSPEDLDVALAMIASDDI